MNTVNTGLDGLNLTFAPPSKYSNDPAFTIEAISSLFPGLTPENFFAERSALSWYTDCLTLGCHTNTSKKYTTLMQYHTGHHAKKNKRNLLQVNGLCFSDSALNALRPLSVGDLVYWASYYHANISAFDVYLDDFSASLSQIRLNEMSQPHTFADYIQSPFLRSKDGEKPLPRPYAGKNGETTWYYGQADRNFECNPEERKATRNLCEVTSYNKGLSPRQRVHSKANPLKTTWQRYELRFVGDTSKRQGKLFFNDLVHGANLNRCVTELFREYLRFTEPQNNNRPSDWPLQAWYEDLLYRADQQEPVVLKWSGQKNVSITI